VSKKVEKDLLSRRKTRRQEKGLLLKGDGEGDRESTFRSEVLLNALPDLIFMLNQDGNILDYHAPDPSLLFAPPSAFLGINFKKVLPDDLGEKLETIFHQITGVGQLQSLEYPLSISGKIHQFEARIIRFDQDKMLVIIRDISGRKELEEALKENQEKYRQIVDHAPTGIYEIDYWNQKIVRVNDAMCEITGYTREEILSLNPIELLTDDSKRFFSERLQEIVANHPVSSEVTFKIKTKPGREIWALLNTRFTYENGVLRGANVVAHDITALKSAEEALRESEGHLRSLMESAENFAVYRLAFDDNSPYGIRVVFVSPSIEQLTGVSEAMNFETWFKHIHPDDYSRVVEAQIKANETLRFNETMRIFHPHKGEWRWMQAISASVPDTNGRLKYINGIIIDLTEKKAAEEALQKAHDHLEQRVKQRTTQLRKINEQLKKEIKERKEFEAALSKSEKKLRLLSNKLINTQEDERKRIAIELHDELGQSLIGLKFQLSNLYTKLRGKRMGIGAEMEQALTAIDVMTEDVRCLSKELHPSVLEHLGLFEALCWLFGESSRKYLFKIINSIPESRQTFSKEQEIIIFRIFQEALTNIGKHAQARQVWVDMMEQAKGIIFSIKDDGKGFDFRELSDSPITERGLGLTAMDERARMAGGAITLWSQKGKGTKITFTVPVKKGRKKGKTCFPEN
jgi:PAS domain S-box-containing protein